MTEQVKRYRFCSGMHNPISGEVTYPEMLRDDCGEWVLYSVVAERIAKAEQELKDWKTWGVIEIAVRNPNVAEYCKHWEDRTERAEQRNRVLKEALKLCEHKIDQFLQGQYPDGKGLGNALAVARATLSN